MAMTDPLAMERDELNALRRQALKLIQEHRKAERESLRHMRSDLVDIARLQGVFNRPDVTWEDARRWTAEHCRALIGLYQPGARRFVW